MNRYLFAIMFSIAAAAGHTNEARACAECDAAEELRQSLVDQGFDEETAIGIAGYSYFGYEFSEFQ
jgi:hypothetical protein